jgi:hypothetical protein
VVTVLLNEQATPLADTTAPRLLQIRETT